jgi:preprotein translocase subunit SecG
MIIYKLVMIIHVVNVILLIAVVLLQTGKGSEVGFAFGSGAAQTMFGSSGGKTFITRFTVVLAVLFMFTSIFLAFYQAKVVGGYKGVMDNVKTEQPVAPQGAQPPAGEKPVAPAGNVPPADK